MSLCAMNQNRERERKGPIDMKMGKEQHPFGRGYAFEEELFFYLLNFFFLA